MRVRCGGPTVVKHAYGSGRFSIGNDGWEKISWRRFYTEYERERKDTVTLLPNAIWLDAFLIIGLACFTCCSPCRGVGDLC